MSLRSNILVNYFSQAWVALAGIAAMPFYLQRMGVEAYGLVGFFTLLNAWFLILDAGLSLTLARECARYRAGAIDAATLGATTSLFERVFASIAGAGALAMVAAARPIAASWLHAQHLPLGVVATSVLLMGLTVPLQWMTNVYRGALIGFERQALLGYFNILMATLRYGGAAALLVVAPPSPLNFFTYQLGVSILELGALIALARRTLPKVDPAARRGLSRPEVNDLLRLSGSLAFAVVAWILVTQLDKLILSKVLPLGEYGVFTLAIVAANGVAVLSAPISVAVLPRMVKVSAEGDPAAFERLYRDATQVVCVMTAPAALVLAVFAGPVLLAWTGQPDIAKAAAPILTPYAIGGGIVAVAAFPYYLQYARGNLRLHIVGSALLIVLMVPSVTLAALRFGAVGAGYVWLAVNALYFLAWVPVVHTRLAPGLQGRWLVNDILPVWGAAGFTMTIVGMVAPWPHDRLAAAILVVAASLPVVVAAGAASSFVRGWLRDRWSRLQTRSA